MLNAKIFQKEVNNGCLNSSLRRINYWRSLRYNFTKSSFLGFYSISAYSIKVKIFTFAELHFVGFDSLLLLKNEKSWYNVCDENTASYDHICYTSSIFEHDMNFTTRETPLYFRVCSLGGNFEFACHLFS